MTTMIERVKTAITEELSRQKIGATTWGNNFDGINPPVDWKAVAQCAIEAVQEPPANPKDGVRISRMLSDNGFMVSADVKMPAPEMTPDKNGMYLLGFVLLDDELKAAKARARPTETPV